MNKETSLFRRIKGDIENMSDKEFLATRGFYDLIKSQIYGVLKKGESISVELVSTNDNETAYTNGKLIHCNTWSPLVLPCETRYLKYLSNIGSASHECGHVLYTNFTVLNRVRKAIANGTYNFKYKDELKKRNFEVQQKFVSSMMDMINIVEDMYIENCLMNEYPAEGILVQGLHAGNKIKYDLCPTMPNFIIEIETKQILFLDAFINLLQIVRCLGYQPKDSDLCSGKTFEELMKSLEDVKPLVDEYRDKEYSHEDVIRQLVEICYEMLPDDEELFMSNPNMGGNGKNSNSDQCGGDTDCSDSKGDGNSDKKQGTEGTGSDDQNQGESSGSDASENSKPLSNEEKKELMRKLTETAESMKRKTCQSKECEGSGDAVRNKPESNGEIHEAPKSFVNQEQSLNKQVAEMESNNKESNERAEKSKLNAKETMSGYFPRARVSATTVQCVAGSYESNARAQYMYDYEAIAQCSKSCQRMIKQILNKKQDEEFDSGHVMGSLFNVADYYRKDGKYFSREVTPGEEPDIVFSVLVDVSGSMMGKKIVAARRAAILIDDMCRGLKIPCSVTTHTADYSIRLEDYVYFDSPEKDKYLLGKIISESANVDTVAVSIKANELLKRPEKTKVLFVISDGLPCSTVLDTDDFKGVPFKKLENCKNGYDREMQELNACVRYWRKKKDIKIIGFAVDEAEQVKAIYETGCIDCSNLENLPKEMVRIFKKYVLKNK